MMRLSLSTLLLFLATAVSAQDQAGQSTLITGARIFDGMSETLIEGQDVLVSGNTIAQIAADISAPEGAAIIDAGGQTLIPGLIDMHYHPMWAAIPTQVALSSDLGYIALVAADNAEKLLMQGFTTVREAGGGAFGLKHAIDQGLYPGPRIYPAGAIISQTSGHGDFRSPMDTPETDGTPLNYMARTNQTIVADGVPDVTKRVREQLRAGATQIKLAAGGGATSDFDPLDVAQYTYEELKAAVDVAKTWNTYVMAHVYTPAGIQTALEAGVMSIEHGHLMDEKTAQLIAEKGAWVSLQPFMDDEEAIPFPPRSPQQIKQKQVFEGTDRAYKLARQYGLKTAFGTDVLFSADLAAKNGKQLAKLETWYTPFEVLKMATHDNAQLLKLSGPRNPYAQGDLGIIAEGAYADLILVNGNPLEDLQLIVDPATHFSVIMKNGVIHKNNMN